MKNLRLVVILLFIPFNFASFAQAGISVSPGRLYFHEAPGSDAKKIIQVTNPTNRELEVGVSFGDWNYSMNGSNQLAEAGSLETSCADWIQVLPGTYFVLQPRETKRVEVVFQVPEKPDVSIPARTAMLFFTQLNPGSATDASGAAIQVTVRMGVKIYHSFLEDVPSRVEISDLNNFLGSNGEKVVELKLLNNGDIWADGTVKWEIFSENTGEKVSLHESEFYTLPGDLRSVRRILPDELKPGNYTLSAILTYGEKDIIKIAELAFTL